MRMPCCFLTLSTVGTASFYFLGNQEKEEEKVGEDCGGVGGRLVEEGMWEGDGGMGGEVLEEGVWEDGGRVEGRVLEEGVWSGRGGC